VIDPDLRDLPGLCQWGDELREATSRVEEERGRRRQRRGLPVGRLGIAVAATFLLVPGAVATRSIWDDPVQRVAPLSPAPSTPAVRLAQGHDAGLTWRVGGYEGGAAQRCLRFEVLHAGAAPGQIAGCPTPRTRAGITVQISNLPGVGFVFGTTASTVTSVDIVVGGGGRVRVATASVPSDVVRRSRMRGAFRVFVATFRNGVSTAQMPEVTGRDAGGRVVGRVAG
jgi:hypothetical protein